MVPASVHMFSVRSRNHWKSSLVIPSGGSSACGDWSNSSAVWLVGVGVEGLIVTAGLSLALPLFSVAMVVSCFLEDDLDGEQDLPFMVKLRWGMV